MTASTVPTLGENCYLHARTATHFLDLQGSIGAGDHSLNEPLALQCAAQVPYTNANCAPCGFASEIAAKARKPDTPTMRHGVHDT